VVSKYIGETEKNLASLFDKAEGKEWSSLRRGGRALREANRHPRRPRQVRQPGGLLPAAADRVLRRPRDPGHQPAQQHRRGVPPSIPVGRLPPPPDARAAPRPLAASLPRTGRGRRRRRLARHRRTLRAHGSVHRQRHAPLRHRRSRHQHAAPRPLHTGGRDHEGVRQGRKELAESQSRTSSPVTLGRRYESLVVEIGDWHRFSGNSTRSCWPTRCARAMSLVQMPEASP
jgi:hypothetical protein